MNVRFLIVHAFLTDFTVSQMACTVEVDFTLNAIDSTVCYYAKHTA